MGGTRRAFVGGWKGARLRCPRCAGGRMSSGLLAFTRFRDTCDVCGLRFEKTPGEFTGAMTFAQGLLGIVGLGLYFVFYGYADVPILRAAVWTVIFGILVPLVTYRHMKGAWIGVMYGIDPWGGPPPPTTDAPALPQQDDADIYDGWSAFDAGDFAGARAHAERVLARRPGDHDAMMLVQALREREGTSSASDQAASTRTPGSQNLK